VLEARDLVVYMNQANVYQTNPVTSMLEKLPRHAEARAGGQAPRE
jgi:hypothetical protein